MSDASALARALRQRLELGAPPFFFADLDRDAVMHLAQAGRTEREAVGVSSPEVPVPHGSPARAAPAPAAADHTAAREVVGPVAKAVDTAAAPTVVRAPAPPDTSGMTLQVLADTVAGCTRCGLSTTRTQAVFADGHAEARVMVVGEAPGANEDRTGLPFVGAAGKLLDLMLASVGLSRRDSVYICNVIKCRPPGNRNPSPDEIATCAPYLRRQIELVEPEVILAVGTFAGQLLTGRADTALGKLRGDVHSYEGVPLVVTYHPAALLRNGGWKRPTWDDLQLLRRVMEDA